MKLMLRQPAAAAPVIAIDPISASTPVLDVMSPPSPRDTRCRRGPRAHDAGYATSRRIQAVNPLLTIHPAKFAQRMRRTGARGYLHDRRHGGPGRKQLQVFPPRPGHGPP